MLSLPYRSYRNVLGNLVTFEEIVWQSVFTAGLVAPKMLLVEQGHLDWVHKYVMLNNVRLG